MWTILIFDGTAALFLTMTIAGLGQLRCVRRLPALEAFTPTESRARCSVIIAARDEEARIEQTVRHLLAQRGVELEIIVVDELVDDFFRLYFGAAGQPMKEFYLRLENIACDPANYPAPYHRSNGIDWRKVAWERLGTAERMEQLGALMSQGERLAEANVEKQRVAQWRKAFWEWMRQGREQYLVKTKQPGQ